MNVGSLTDFERSYGLFNKLRIPVLSFEHLKYLYKFQYFIISKSCPCETAVLWVNQYYHYENYKQSLKTSQFKTIRWYCLSCSCLFGKMAAKTRLSANNNVSVYFFSAGADRDGTRQLNCAIGRIDRVHLAVWVWVLTAQTYSEH